MAGHDRMKGSANAAWNGVVKPSGPTKKYGDRVKNRRCGAPGGARVPVTRRAAPQGADLRRCAFRRSAPLALAREKGKEGAAPRRTAKGGEDARPQFGTPAMHQLAEPEGEKPGQLW